MSASAKLAEQYLNGAQVVVIAGPDCPFTRDGLWPVLYQPRSSFDPEPWVRVPIIGDTSSAVRYKGTEVRLRRATSQAVIEANTIALRLRKAGWTVEVTEYRVSFHLHMVYLTARRQWFERGLHLSWSFHPARPTMTRFIGGSLMGSPEHTRKIRTKADRASWLSVLATEGSILHPDHPEFTGDRPASVIGQVFPDPKSLV
jgi:hypothetical protein